MSKSSQSPKTAAPAATDLTAIKNSNEQAAQMLARSQIFIDNQFRHLENIIAKLQQDLKKAQSENELLKVELQSGKKSESDRIAELIRENEQLKTRLNLINDKVCDEEVPAASSSRGPISPPPHLAEELAPFLAISSSTRTLTPKRAAPAATIASPPKRAKTDKAFPDIDQIYTNYRGATEVQTIKLNDDSLRPIRAKCLGCSKWFQISSADKCATFIYHCIRECEKYQALNLVRQCQICKLYCANEVTLGYHTLNDHKDAPPEHSYEPISNSTTVEWGDDSCSTSLSTLVKMEPVDDTDWSGSAGPSSSWGYARSSYTARKSSTNWAQILNSKVNARSIRPGPKSKTKELD